MGDDDDDYITTRCRGRENYSDHCTHNGPSKAVWIEIILVGCIIFGLFFCYLKISNKQRSRTDWIEWNDDDSSDEESGYHYMHPAPPNKPRRSLKQAGRWIAKVSSRSLFGESQKKMMDVSPSTPTEQATSNNANTTSAQQQPVQQEVESGDQCFTTPTKGESSGESASITTPNEGSPVMVKDLFHSCKELTDNQN